MNKTSVILTAILAALLVVGAFVGGWFAGEGRRQQPSVVVQTDTIVFRDTVTEYKPEYIAKEVIRRELVEVTDTVTINDTTYIALPFERREYADSNYRAVITGYCPELESISVYPKTQYITTTITETIEEPAPLITLTLQGGVGGQYDLIHKTWGFGPYVGGGVSIRLRRKK